MNQKRITGSLLRASGKYRKKLNKKEQWKPIALSESLIASDPVFTTPEKWIQKPKAIIESEKIQSYKPLELSPFASVLSSPPRMTHASRIVVPKDLLLPMTIIRNPLFKTDSHGDPNTENNSDTFKYVFAPRYHKDESSQENPNTYYPRNLQTFTDMSSGVNNTEQILMLKKFSLYTPSYSFLDGIDEVGYHVNTDKVIDEMEKDKILESFESTIFPIIQKSQDDKLLLSFHKNVDNFFAIDKNNNLVLNIGFFNKRDPLLVAKLNEKLTSSITLNEETKEFVKCLIKYGILTQDI